ncbi:hypothetical protein [Anaerosalibacter sp. Marseille-P3206]|uniref:hypothetical protein n=1 Tax=Anaerosalibacter sp. Marseille-P3206 TaxID=1871005 RepID=UPI0009845E1B|nr:hypothetical protein [Anaerosalibacter sp. Marseille-P3206]
MDDGRIGNFLLNALNSISKEKEYIIEITVLTIKSLLPSEEEVATRIDYERYKKEMQLWYYYRSGDNEVLLNSFNKPKSDIYFLEKDDSAFIRISPIVFSNNKWDIVREEVLKNILYTTANIETILEGLLLSKILFLTFKNNTNILNEVKEEIINLSQTNFLDLYNDFFRLSINDYPCNFHIDFERKRIEIINILNGLKTNHFKTLAEFLEVVNENIKSEYSPFTIGLYSLKNNIECEKKENISIYENFSEYIYKLNKGRIDPKLLYIDKYIEPDIFSFNVGDVFYHSLLNKCKVIKKETINDKQIIYINTKSGIYKFKK